MIIGLLLIYFIGKSFYELAHTHNRSKWGYAILGIVTYYGLQLLLGFGIGFYLVLRNGDGAITTETELVVTIVGVAIAAFGTWGLHYLLKKSWEKNVRPEQGREDLLDS